MPIQKTIDLISYIWLRYSLYSIRLFLFDLVIAGKYTPPVILPTRPFLYYIIFLQIGRSLNTFIFLLGSQNTFLNLTQSMTKLICLNVTPVSEIFVLTIIFCLGSLTISNISGRKSRFSLDKTIIGIFVVFYISYTTSSIILLPTVNISISPFSLHPALEIAFFIYQSLFSVIFFTIYAVYLLKVNYSYSFLSNKSSKYNSTIGKFIPFTSKDTLLLKNYLKS